MCGATLVKSGWAVTAANCVHNKAPAAFTVRSGTSTRESGGSVTPVAVIAEHPSYNPGNFDYDIALLKLSTPPNAAPASLPAAGSNARPGELATVAGWGATVEGGPLAPHLRATTVAVVGQADCRYVYGATAITDRMLCAGFQHGGKDACQGDTGGPLLIRTALIGIASWGYGCGRPGYPGVYTDVAKLRNWIDTTTS